MIHLCLTSSVRLLDESSARSTTYVTGLSTEALFSFLYLSPIHLGSNLICICFLLVLVYSPIALFVRITTFGVSTVSQVSPIIVAFHLLVACFAFIYSMLCMLGFSLPVNELWNQFGESFLFPNFHLSKL